MATTPSSSPYSKYALAHSVTADSFSFTIDGKIYGPGPAHYGSLKAASIASGDWLWIYAEASQRGGGKGHHYEWSTIVFKSGAKYGFLTPKAMGERDGGGPGDFKFHKIAVGIGGMPIVYMHSHPRGAQAMGTAGKVFSGIELDDDGTFFGDEAAAIQNITLWIGLLAPYGDIKRIQFKEHYRNQLPPDTSFGRQMPMTQQLQKLYRKHKQDMFSRVTDRQVLGRDWKPGTKSWREQCIAEVAYEMRHTPRAK